MHQSTPDDPNKNNEQGHPEYDAQFPDLFDFPVQEDHNQDDQGAGNDLTGPETDRHKKSEVFCKTDGRRSHHQGRLDQGLPHVQKGE